MINYSEELEPDIELKHTQVLNHMASKNKICQQLIKLLKELCDFEHYYSKTLDKLANSVSKLILGKDPLKQILITFERMLATKSEQAETMAISMKDDMIPYLETKCIDLERQNLLKSKSKEIKDIRNQMTKKLRALYNSEAVYKRIYETTKISQNIKNQNLQSSALTQSYTKLTNTIHSYNHSFTKYMQNYSTICQQFTNIEGDRINNVRDSMNKYMIFEMNSARSIEYSITRYMKSLENSEGFMVVQDVGVNSNDTLKLAKISAENYIGAIMEELQKQPPLGQAVIVNANCHIDFFLSLKKRYQLPQSITRPQYHILIQQTFNLMDQALKLSDLTFARQFILNYSQQLYFEIQNQKQLNSNQNINAQEQKNCLKIKLTLLQGLLAHQLFNQKQIWQDYQSNIIQNGKREQKSYINHQKDWTINYISQDLKFLRLVNKNYLIIPILQALGIQLTIQQLTQKLQIEPKTLKKASSLNSIIRQQKKQQSTSLNNKLNIVQIESMI